MGGGWRGGTLLFIACEGWRKVQGKKRSFQERQDHRIHNRDPYMGRNGKGESIGGFHRGAYFRAMVKLWVETLDKPLPPKIEGEV